MRTAEPRTTFACHSVPGRHAHLRPLFLLFGLFGLGCAASTPSTAPAPTLSIRFQDAALACDDEGNVYVCATEIFERSKQVLVASSNRYGESWNRRFDYVNSSLDGDRGRPQLTTGAPGEVYVLWEDTRHGRVDLYFNRSLDGGHSWLDPDILLSGGIQGAVQLAAPSLCADDRGNVYVVWRDEREGFQAFYVNSSRDRGTTWMSEPVRLTSLSTKLKSPPGVACDDEGRLHALWLEIEATTATIHTNTSSDHGRSWNWDSQIIGRLSWVKSLHRPSLAVGSRGTLFAAWQDLQAGRPEILLSRSLDHGRSWEALPRTLRSAQPGTITSPPQIRCDRFGHLYVVWQSLAANGTSQFVVQSSGDDGRQFTETRVPRLGSARLEQELLPQIGAVLFRSSVDDAGNLYLTWTRQDTSMPFVGFDRVSNHGTTWLGLPYSIGSSSHAPRTLEPPLICNDSSGHVFLLWNEGHTLTVASSPFYGDSGWRYEHF